MFLAELQKIVDIENVRINEPMSAHTTFRIGGKTDYFVMPENVEQIRDMIQLCKSYKVPYYVIGNGSNLLVSDNGYRGVVIELQSRFHKFEFVYENIGTSAVDKNSQVYVKAQAGVMLGKLGNDLANNSLTGFEFATGIPGSIGGAVMMNAGAYGGEMKDVIISATVMDSDGEVMVLDKKQLELGYRTSIIAEKGYIVLDALMQFSAGSQQQIKSKIAELATCRREKQPLEYPSAGSTFKRPSGYFAAKLISDAGLKGYKVGGAMVSMKHAGFVVNCDHATAADIIQITDDVRAEVQKQYDVQLELEVKKLGF